MADAVGLMPKEELIDYILSSPVLQDREPEINVALIIASNALHGQTVWSGHDYDLHYLKVGMQDTQSRRKTVIGILHDVVEDTDWELDDLRRVGFSEAIVNGVDGVTKRPGEKYFDFIERCSLNPDSVDIKLSDLKDNSSVSRSTALLTEKQINKLNAYIVSYQYLVALKTKEISPGTPMNEFIETRPELYSPALFSEFSSRPHPIMETAGSAARRAFRQ